MFTDRLYTGQRELTGLGLYNYNARFYSPKLGRFIQPDTIVPGAGSPQAYNRYSYVLNNPIKFSDPSGHFQAEYYQGAYLSISQMNKLSSTQRSSTMSKTPRVILRAPSTNTPTSNTSDPVGGRLYGQPGGSREEIPDDPTGTDFGNNKLDNPPIIVRSQGIAELIKVLEYITYNIVPNLRSPSWYGYALYEMDSLRNPIVPSPYRQPSAANSLWNLTSVGIQNESNEAIGITYVGTYGNNRSQSYDPSINTTGVYPFNYPNITTLGYGIAEPGLSTTVILDEGPYTRIPPECTLFVQINVRSESLQRGQVVVQILP